MKEPIEKKGTEDAEEREQAAKKIKSKYSKPAIKTAAAENCHSEIKDNKSDSGSEKIIKPNAEKKPEDSDDKKANSSPEPEKKSEELKPESSTAINPDSIKECKTGNDSEKTQSVPQKDTVKSETPEKTDKAGKSETDISTKASAEPSVIDKNTQKSSDDNTGADKIKDVKNTASIIKQNEEAAQQKPEGKNQVFTKKSLLIIIFAAVLVVALTFAIAFFTSHTLADGHFYRNGPHMDLRQEELSPSAYDKIREKNPDSEILWTVPIGSDRFDPDSEEISIGNFGTEEIENFSYFTALKNVDARSADCYDELIMLQEAMPDCEIYWEVSIAGETVGSLDSGFKAVPGTKADELLQKLEYLPKLVVLNLTEAGLSVDDEDKIAAVYPKLKLVRGVYIGGVLYTSDMEEVNIDADTEFEIEDLILASERLKNLKHLGLPDRTLSADNFEALCAAYPETDVVCNLNFYGVTTLSDAEELDLSGIQIDDLSELDRAINCMPRLKKVIMSNCGIPDEEMDALNKKYEDVEIVWTVYIKGWFDCRTDADNFCVSRITSRYGDMTDEMVSPIRYCEKMVTLDLGHMYYYNIDFVENMPDLRYLIIGDTNVESLEPLRNCPHLYYLECFLTYVHDLSPLYGHDELKHLNISYCQLDDYTQLFNFKQLDRLWFVRSGLTWQQQQEIIEALPNTEVCFYTDDDSSVDYFWRIDDSYFDMRDNLGMWYHYSRPEED